MKNFNIIVAMDKNHGIGKKGLLPWHMPADLRYFKEVTTSAPPGKINAVIMGRKTWESIPSEFRPLSGRLNVVLTRNPDHNLPDECLKAGSLDEAFDAIEKRPDIERIFVIGGASIYEQAVHLQTCQTLYITMIAEEFDCDACFPSIFESYRKVYQSDERFENGCHFSFLEFQRNSV